MKFGNYLKISLITYTFVFVPWTSITKAESIVNFLPAIIAASQGQKQGSQYDNDLDGYSENQGDCNDKENSIYPSASEVCGDGIDQDCSGSDLLCGTAVLTVTSAGQTWMDRNLGASRVAISSTDSEAYGDLYQWGRLTDGHEKRNSPLTTVTSSNDVPGHGNFIVPEDSFSDIDANPDWRTPQNDVLWQGVAGINNPCPSGFRLPTNTELDTERASWSSNNPAGAFASPLKLVLAGARCADGELSGVGSTGLYWSSTVSVIKNLSDIYHSYSGNLAFLDNSAVFSLDGDGSILNSFGIFTPDGAIFNSFAYVSQAGFSRATGESVRCIKD